MFVNWYVHLPYQNVLYVPTHLNDYHFSVSGKICWADKFHFCSIYFQQLLSCKGETTGKIDIEGEKIFFVYIRVTCILCIESSSDIN